VVFLFVMTVATGCPEIAGAALQLRTPSIVLATQDAMGFIKVGFLLILFGEPAVGGRFRRRATPTALEIGVGHKSLDT
jgi:hypothetical protein